MIDWFGPMIGMICAISSFLGAILLSWPKIKRRIADNHPPQNVSAQQKEFVFKVVGAGLGVLAGGLIGLIIGDSLGLEILGTQFSTGLVGKLMVLSLMVGGAMMGDMIGKRLANL